MTQKDDKLPKICLTALKEGSTDGVLPDMKKMLKEYYEYRKWDRKTGKPTKKKLTELGLDQAAKDLY